MMHAVVRRSLDFIALIGFTYLLLFWVSRSNDSVKSVLNTIQTTFFSRVDSIALSIWALAVVIVLIVRDRLYARISDKAHADTLETTMSVASVAVMVGSGLAIWFYWTGHMPKLDH